LGGAHVRSENVSRLRGQGGRSDMLAICDSYAAEVLKPEASE
jgi:hypothetical protein